MTSLVEYRSQMLDNPYYMAAWAVRCVGSPFPDNLLIAFFADHGVEVDVDDSLITLQVGVQRMVKQYTWWVWSLLNEQKFDDWVDLIAWLIEVRERIDD